MRRSQVPGKTILLIRKESLSQIGRREPAFLDRKSLRDNARAQLVQLGGVNTRCM
jgi:hypothetical protein